MKPEIDDVRQYWDSHLNLTQFLPSEDVEVGSDVFWSHLERSMSRYAYKQHVLERFAEQCGGGKLLDVSLRNVAAKVATLTAANPGRAIAKPLPPRARPFSQAAAPLGRDTDRVLSELGIRC